MEASICSSWTSIAAQRRHSDTCASLSPSRPPRSATCAPCRSFQRRVQAPRPSPPMAKTRLPLVTLDWRSFGFLPAAIASLTFWRPMAAARAFRWARVGVCEAASTMFCYPGAYPRSVSATLSHQ